MDACECVCAYLWDVGHPLMNILMEIYAGTFCLFRKSFGSSFIFSIAFMTRRRQTLSLWVCGVPETTQVWPMGCPFPG